MDTTRSAPDLATQVEVKATAPSQAAASPESAVDRRSFLGIGAATIAAAGLLTDSARAQNGSAQNNSGFHPIQRRIDAYRRRTDAALANALRPLVQHPANGDELRYPNKIASFSKGLPHNAYGEVDVAAFRALVAACDSEVFGDFEQLPSGEPNPALRRKLVNPMSGASFDLEGQDSHDFTMRAAPRFASAEQAGEIVENYWMALLRDVAFTDYGSTAIVARACADLSAMSDFRGPKAQGAVTPQTLFRAGVEGDRFGPLLSQFFWKSQPFGAQFIEPRMRTVRPGFDYMTTNATWLAAQNGSLPVAGQSHDSVLRYLRNGRDLGEWVHIDVLYQAYFQAALHLLTPPDPSNPFTGGGLGAALNPGNPYRNTQMQDGFGTFGGPYIMTLLTEVATRALKAVWFQKWYIHRRLRPEAFGGRIHHRIVSNQQYPIHADALNSAALAETFSRNGTYFLPMAFPEGSPLHPAYGAGHATVAGACATIIKAMFDTQVPFPNPVVATNDGLSLVPYTGADAGQMTVEGELNKIAANVAFGRNIAGVHWRTDGSESLTLGEEVAISVLRDQRSTYLEPFSGFTFRRFDGSTVTV